LFAEDYFDGGDLSLELICAGRSLLTGRPLAALFDLGGLTLDTRQNSQYKDGDAVYGFVCFCGFSTN
jgi:hypothetical protein